MKRTFSERASNPSRREDRQAKRMVPNNVNRSSDSIDASAPPSDDPEGDDSEGNEVNRIIRCFCFLHDDDDAADFVTHRPSLSCRTLFARLNLPESAAETAEVCTMHPLRIITALSPSPTGETRVQESRPQGATRLLTKCRTDVSIRLGT